MEEVPITWQRVLSIFWLYTWRSFLGALLIGGILGFVLGFFGALLRFESATVRSTISIIVVPVVIVWTFYVMRMALHKKFRDFRIALIALPKKGSIARDVGDLAQR